ncbi:hypothetical protein JW796_02345 [Candidatus Dojkabacteria bacterium]|nr:hypothetical protein [Candidatus Dojkabacteria bacterium]
MSDDNKNNTQVEDLEEQDIIPDENDLEEIEDESGDLENDDLDLDENEVSASDHFYSDDVAAAAIADVNLDPDKLIPHDEDPVTSGEMEIGDLDIDEDDTDLSGSDDEENDATFDID